jgi:hypothetical protein
MKTERTQTADLPVRGKLTLAYAVSLGTAVLVAIASLAGLLVPATVYPADELLQAFVPNDVVNLAVGLPILLGSMWLARRGKLVGLLFWPGALFYLFYTYVVYVLGMPLNATFLLHLALVTLSAYTLVGLLASIDGDAVRDRLAGAVPERVGGGVLAGLGILFFLRVAGVMGAAIVNETPVAETELALHVADFVLAPAMVIGGLLLWRRQALGYLTGLGLLFQATMLFVGLIFILILQPFVTGAPFVLGDVLVVLVMSLVCLIPFVLFVRGAASKRSPPAA